MPNQSTNQLDKYLRPPGPARNDNPQTPVVAWQWGVTQSVQLKKIRSSTAFFNKLSANILGSVTNITGGTINTSRFSTGTIVNSSFQGTISQPVTSGGTFTNPYVNTGTFNNSLYTGTLNNSVIGTPSIVGGTVNSILQATGTAGTLGSIIYVKSVNFAGSTTALGTVNFSNGLITSFN